VQGLEQHHRHGEVRREPGEDAGGPVRTGAPDDLAVVRGGDGAEQGEPGAHVGAAADGHLTQRDDVTVGTRQP
jgi:hypothetical protein